MGSDINKTELYNSTSMAVARSSGPGGRMPEYYKGKGRRVTVSKSESFAEAASQMPNYSYANYSTPSPAVVYTRCENEANKLVQTLERYVKL